MQLTGSAIAVTGGASGLGFATARRLVKAGARVTLIDLPTSEGDKAAAELGDAAQFAAGDVTARLSEGYIKVGRVPGDGGCYFLPRLAGMAKALELLWTGDFIDAEEALRLGIASHVYADADFAASAHAFASRIAAQPPLNVQLIKRAAYQSARTDLRTALDLISSHMAVVRSTHDSAEAMAAFRERRLP